MSLIEATKKVLENAMVFVICGVFIISITMGALYILNLLIAGKFLLAILVSLAVLIALILVTWLASPKPTLK